MEVKKKFEKPQMEVVKLKPAGMVCGSSDPELCGNDCGNDCPQEGACLFND